MGNVATYKTTLTIPATEIVQVLDKGQRLLADLALTMGYQQIQGEKISCQCIALQLYLYLYAIQTWDQTPNAINYFDQFALIRIMSKVEQLFYICNYNKPC